HVNTAYFTGTALEDAPGKQPSRASAQKERTMNGKQIGLSLVLADFVLLTGYAVYHYGYLAFFDVHALNAIQLQIFVDLIIALTMVLVWMWRDARARGLSPVPYAVITLFLGSIGPLIYLIRREATEAPPVGKPVAVAH